MRISLLSCVTVFFHFHLQGMIHGECDMIHSTLLFSPPPFLPPPVSSSIFFPPHPMPSRSLVISLPTYDRDFSSVKPSMEVVNSHADWSFVGKKPFGVLLLALMLLPLMIIIGIVLAPFVFEGFGFVRSWSLTLFIMALFFNAAHIFGLQRKVFSMGTRALYIPFTLMIFFTCLLFMLLYAFASLLSLISVFDSLKYSIRLIITYIIILGLNMALTYVCARICILLFRASPNSKVLLLSTVVIEGEKAVRMESMASSNGGQFTPAAGTPMGMPPV